MVDLLLLAPELFKLALFKVIVFPLGAVLDCLFCLALPCWFVSPRF
jgi:hypothetical protein